MTDRRKETSSKVGPGTVREVVYLQEVGRVAERRRTSAIDGTSGPAQIPGLDL